MENLYTLQVNGKEFDTMDVQCYCAVLPDKENNHHVKWKVI